MNIKPYGGRVVVKRFKADETTKSGILIPGKSKEEQYMGKVVAVGEGMYTDSGVRIPMETNIGDKIVFAKYSGIPVELETNNELYIVLNERDILFKYE